MAADPLRKFQPQVGHWRQDVFVNRDGSAGIMWHLQGLAAELAGARAVIGAWAASNQMVHGVASARLELWDHLVRQDRRTMTALPPTGNWLADRFDAAYRASQGHGLFQNDLFVTALLRPEGVLQAGFAALLRSGDGDHPELSDAMLQDLDAVADKLEAGMRDYGARRLGIREQDGLAFSEIAEALHLIANGRFRPIGLSADAMGPLIQPDRVVFGHRDFEMVRDGGSTFGAVIAIHTYPARTRAGMLDNLAGVQGSLTLTNATQLRGKADALGKLALRIKQMQSGNDAAKSQVAELEQDRDNLMSGRSVAVVHHMLVTVRADTLPALDRLASDVQTVLSNAGITSVRESDAMEAAKAAELPGNMRWRTRPGQTTSINATALASRHGVPRGRSTGRWGAPVINLRTTANTEYPWHWHVQGSAQLPKEDQGNTLMVGMAGTGKTTLLGCTALLTLRNPAARVVLIDKDLGLANLARGGGGSYLALRNGRTSGQAPLLAMEDTPGDLAFITEFTRGLMLSDGQGELESDDDHRLGVLVAAQLRMPPAARSFSQIAVGLGHRRRANGGDGAQARLRKWCRGERLGWAFDNERDELDMGRRIIGFDTTEVLKEPLVASPTLAHLFYRTSKLLDGRPLLLGIDEFWQSDSIPAFRAHNKDRLKTIRKLEGAVVLATQSAGDALASEDAHTLKEQTPTKVFFGDKEANRAHLVDGLGLTEAEFHAVSVRLPNMRHTFLVKRPGGSVLCRFDLSAMPGLVALVSGRRSTYDLATRLMARHGAAPEQWVPHFEAQAPGLVDEPTQQLTMVAAE